MTQVVPAVFLWVATAALIVTRSRGRDMSPLIATVCLAISLTLNIDPAYRRLDALTGNRNYTELVADLVLVVGVSALLRAVLNAIEPTAARELRGANTWGLGVTCILLAVTFASIRMSGSSTDFMLDYGAQPAAATYSIIEFGYLGLGALLMAIVVLRNSRNIQSAPIRLGLTVSGFGAVLGVGLAADVIGMDVFHVNGDLVAMRALGAVYPALYVISVCLACAGQSLAPLARRLRERRERRLLQHGIRALAPVWLEYVTPGAAIQTSRRLSPELRLHRMVVEIRDAMMQLQDEATFVPELEHAESLLRRERGRV